MTFRLDILTKTGILSYSVLCTMPEVIYGEKTILRSKKGYKTGLFKSWAECEAAVKSFPSPEYKGFVTEEEAQAYLNGENIYLEQIKRDIADGYVVAFTDGSYDEKTNQYGYGICIFDLECNEIDLCNKVPYDPFSSSRNIAGEIFGVLTALDWAVSNEYEKIRIYHDLDSISKWASGEYKAESEIAKYYVSKLDERFKNIIRYEFVKVNGHSNNPYNEKADSLASSALQGERKMIQGANSFTVANFGKDELDVIIQLIKEECKNIQERRKAILGGEQIELKAGPNRVVIKIYNNKKLLVQGNPNAIYQIVFTYISELLGEKHIVPLVKQAYRMKVDTNILEANYANLCPNIPDSYNANIKTLIRQSIINLNGYFDAEEYGQYAFPALRALEGHLKYLFSKHGIHIDKRGFEQFCGNPVDGYTLKSDLAIPSPDNTNIENCYNFFVKSRHKIFHFGDIIGNTDNTMMISSKKDADDIIREALRLINNSVY